MAKIKISKKNWWWILIPALALQAQIIGLLFFGPATSLQTQTSAKRAASIPLTPSVLGASTMIRGGQAQDSQPEYKKIKELDFNDIGAKSVLAFDMDSGYVLGEKNPDMKMPIASLTKLMTGLVSYETLDFGALAEIPDKTLINIAPVLHLQASDKVLIWDLFNSMIIGSNNDSAQVLSILAKQATGKDFIDLMNEKAAFLNMENTKFSNPLGFDSGLNYSTANDLKILVLQTQKLAAFANLGKKTDYSFSSQSGRIYKTSATNKLITRYPEIEAVKTGFTETAQGAMISKLNINGHKIILEILGSPNREKDTLELERQIIESFGLR